MHPFEINPGWYDTYWYSERPHRQPNVYSRGFARFAAIAVLLLSHSTAA